MDHLAFSNTPSCCNTDERETIYSCLNCTSIPLDQWIWRDYAAPRGSHRDLTVTSELRHLSETREQLSSIWTLQGTIKILSYLITHWDIVWGIFFFCFTERVSDLTKRVWLCDMRVAIKTSLMFLLNVYSCSDMTERQILYTKIRESPN